MPTQIELEFRATGKGATQNEKLAAYFRTFPGQWIPMPQLAAAINAFAVHSRVSDLRRGKWSMNIEQRNVPGQRGHSEYRFLP